MVEQVQLDIAKQGLSHYNLNQLPLHFSVPLSPLQSLSALSACSSLLLAISNPIFLDFFRSLTPILPPLVYLSQLSLNITHSPLSLSHQFCHFSHSISAAPTFSLSLFCSSWAAECIAATAAVIAINCSLHGNRYCGGEKTATALHTADPTLVTWFKTITK